MHPTYFETIRPLLEPFAEINNIITESTKKKKKNPLHLAWMLTCKPDRILYLAKNWLVIPLP